MLLEHSRFSFAPAFESGRVVGQDLQALTPVLTSLYLLLVQSTQEVALAAVALRLPSAQAMQAATPVEAPLYLPAPQPMHCLAPGDALYLPPGQGGDLIKDATFRSIEKHCCDTTNTSASTRSAFAHHKSLTALHHHKLLLSAKQERKPVRAHRANADQVEHRARALSVDFTDH